MRPLNCVDVSASGETHPQPTSRPLGVGPQIKWWPVVLEGAADDMIGPQAASLGIQCVEPAA